MAQGRDDKFGAMLRGFRKKLNLSQFTLAVEAGLSARTICDLERGINQPRPYSLDQIADALESHREGTSEAEGGRASPRQWGEERHLG